MAVSPTPTLVSRHNELDEACDSEIVVDADNLVLYDLVLVFARSSLDLEETKSIVLPVFSTLRAIAAIEVATRISVASRPFRQSSTPSCLSLVLLAASSCPHSPFHHRLLLSVGKEDVVKELGSGFGFGVSRNRAQLDCTIMLTLGVGV